MSMGVRVVIFMWVVTFVWGFLCRIFRGAASVKQKWEKSKGKNLWWDNILAMMILFDLGGIVYVAFWLLFIR